VGLLQGTVDDWRKEMLEELSDLESAGVARVEWLTARDEHVCPLCAARAGKIYTIAEARKELEGEFCKPREPDERCRCTFLPVLQ